MQADWRRWGGPVLGACLAAVALAWQFRPFFPRFDTHLIGDHGDALLLHLHCAWQWTSLAEARWDDWLRLPTLAPYTNGFAFGELLLGVTLPLFPVFWLTGSTAATFNVGVMVSFAALGLAVFLWVRALCDSGTAGALAAIAVVFVPWRLHYLSAVNVLTLHYLVLCFYCVTRWLREPRLGFALAAALLFTLQALTATQAAIAGAYLGAIWMLGLWIASGFAVDRRRCWQGALAGGLALALSLPWLRFHQDAFTAHAGLLRTTEMFRYSETFAEMARLFGAFGVLGAVALVGLLAIPRADIRRALPHGTVASLVALGVGTGALFVIGRGPYLGDPADPTVLPGYYAALGLPGLESLRAPIRIAAFTSVYLALWVGVAARVAVDVVGARWPRPVVVLLPLLAVALWPSLDPGMATPIRERAEDMQLAERLAALPAQASVLSLPLQLNHRGGSAVDERVLLHRRRQVGGFASVVPLAFWRATRNLGAWPLDGHAVIRALGASHLVVPVAWVEAHADAVSKAGYRRLERVGDRWLLEVSRRELAIPRYALRAPGFAAANASVTLALAPDAPVFLPRGHARVAARWRGPSAQGVEAHVFYPGVGLPDAPIQVHVPTPAEEGEYTLEVDVAEQAVRTTLALRRVATSREQSADTVRLRVRGDAPARVRLGQPFGIDVELRAAPGPVWLASSTVSLPDRQGEAELVYRYLDARGEVGGATSSPRTALPHDLAPGDRIEARWYLMAPPFPGRFDVEARLVPANTAQPLPPWQPLLQGLEVGADR